jgi:hypothetical protein
MQCVIPGRTVASLCDVVRFRVHMNNRHASTYIIATAKSFTAGSCVQTRFPSGMATGKGFALTTYLARR